MKGIRVLKISGVLLGSSNPKRVNLTAFKYKNRDGEPDVAIIQHSENVKNAHKEYKRRWKIEASFKHLKTGGLNLEDSQLKKRNRFETLVQVLFMSVAWILYASKKIPEIKVKCNSVNRLSLFRSGIEKLIRYITQGKIYTSNCIT